MLNISRIPMTPIVPRKESVFESARNKAIKASKWTGKKTKMREWLVPPCEYRGDVIHATIKRCCGGERAEEIYACQKVGEAFAFDCTTCRFATRKRAAKPKPSTSVARPKLPQASAPTRPVATPQGLKTRPCVLVLRRPAYDKPYTRVLIDDLLADGWDAREITTQDLADVRNSVERKLMPKPDVILRWEEHGRLFVTAAWAEFVDWCYRWDICPASIDLGYLDHYKSLIIDRYDRNGTGSVISREMDSMPSIVDWTIAPAYVRAWRDRLFDAWEQAGREGPVDGMEPGYVAVFSQYAASLARPAFASQDMTEWTRRAVAAIQGAGLRAVIKASPVGPFPVIAGAPCYAAKRKEEVIPGIHVHVDPMLNVRLLRHARHAVICCSSVSSEMSALGLPVVATGRSWFEGLGVFDEPAQWPGVADCQSVNHSRRAQWINWWLSRQFPMGQAGPALRAALGRHRAEPYDYGALYSKLYGTDERYGGRYPRNDAVLAAAKATGGNTLLDVGCGRGFLVRDALGAGLDATGVDCQIPHNSVEPARTRVADAFALPWPAGAFDVVTCMDMLEHLLPRDVPRAIRELARVASKAVIVTVGMAPAAWKSPPGWPNLHMTVQGVKEWTRALEAAGLRPAWDGHVFVCGKGQR